MENKNGKRLVCILVIVHDQSSQKVTSKRRKLLLNSIELNSVIDIKDTKRM